MSTEYSFMNNQQINTRIDAIIRELEALRLLLNEPSLKGIADEKKGSLTEKLFGSAGQGSWDEYDLNLDSIRFANEYID